MRALVWYYGAMFATGMGVQWKSITGRATVPGMSVDPLAQEEETTERVSLDLPSSVARFLEQFARYRNALNAAQGRNVKKWTRKSAAEALVAAQVRQVMESMAAAFEKHGPLPESADEKEMLAYARAVLAVTDKNPKKTSR